MPVPTLVTDLSTTLASNSPAGSDNVFPDLDNYLRAMSGFIASIRDNSGNGWVSPYLPLTYSAGTANGVVYLNGSKVVTTGSALVFDGTNLGIGTSSPSAKLQVVGGQVLLDNGQFYGIKTSGGANNSVLNLDASNNLLVGAGGATVTTQLWTGGSERARITSGGDLLVGTTGNANNYKTHILTTGAGAAIGIFQNNATTPYGINVYYGAASPNNSNANTSFLYCNDLTTLRIQLASNGGIINYQANNSNLSDRREKTDFAPAKSYLDTICAIPVQTFKYIDQTDDAPTLGVVAQDVQAVAPELVMESNWGTEDNPKMRLSIYETDLQYALMKCIQEQQALIADLRARVAALEAA